VETGKKGLRQLPKGRGTEGKTDEVTPSVGKGIQDRIKVVRNMATDDIHGLFVSPK
jgi:hypothetical protein